MLHLSKIVFISLLISIITDQSFAQQAKINFEQIGLRQGLSQSTVNAIVQDAQGFMWFGTQDGLNRYDGYSIKVFKHNHADLNSLSDDRINCLLSDSMGDLWIGTSTGGVNRYVVAENKFYRYTYNYNDSITISNNTISCLFEDSDQNIWIGTNSGLNLYDRKSNAFRRIFFDSENPLSPNGNSVTAICEDKENNIWVGTYKGLFTYNLKSNFGFVRINELNSHLTTLYGDNVTSLYVDRSGSLWIGTFDQFLKRYDIKTNSFETYINTIKTVKTIYEDSKGNLWIGSLNMSLRVLNLMTNSISKIPVIQNDPINILYEDKSGILWVGTSFRGIFVFNPSKDRFEHYLEDPYNPNVVMAILEDNERELWIGTYGNGLKHFNKKRDKFNTYIHNPVSPKSISSDKIFTLCMTSDGILWIGTIGGGLNYFDKSTGIFKQYIQNSPLDSNGLSNNDITALYETQNGELVIGNAAGGIDILNRKTKIFRHYAPEVQSPITIGAGRSVTVISEDGNGTMWVGTLNGLKQFDPKLNSLLHFNIGQKAGRQDIDNISVTCLLFSKDIIWIGTSRTGLLKFDTKSNMLASYSTNEGLPDNVVLGILPDNSGNLWLSTNKGISKFSPETKIFKNYDINDGLQAKEFNQGAYFKSLKGELFFGGVNGFNSFYPNEVGENKFIPPVYLTKFSVFNEPMSLPNPIPDKYEIELSYSQNFFSFEFTALNYTAPEKNKYAYMLTGFDKEWHTATASQRYASYTNLDPGNYVLKVIGSNNDGIWNEKGTSVKIIIHPPFWMTWWFRISIAIAILGLIIFIYKYRVKQLLRIEQMRVRIASDLHDEIGSSIGSIVLRSRVLQKELNKNPEKTGWTNKSKEELQRIYHTASQVAAVMRDIVWFINPDFDKVDDMILRMKDTAQNLLTEIHYDFFAPNEILTSKLTLDFRRNIFLSYKEVLHNIVKHSKATKVIIKVSISNGILYLEISDNGIGFDACKHLNSGISEGTGLKNLRKRMEVINGTINIQSAPDTGTKVIISAKTT